MYNEKQLDTKRRQKNMPKVLILCILFVPLCPASRIMRESNIFQTCHRCTRGSAGVWWIWLGKFCASLPPSKTNLETEQNETNRSNVGSDWHKTQWHPRHPIGIRPLTASCLMWAPKKVFTFGKEPQSHFKKEPAIASTANDQILPEEALGALGLQSVMPHHPLVSLASLLAATDKLQRKQHQQYGPENDWQKPPTHISWSVHAPRSYYALDPHSRSTSIMTQDCASLEPWWKCSGINTWTLWISTFSTSHLWIGGLAAINFRN